MPAIRIEYHEKSRLRLISGPVRESVNQIRATCPEALLYIRTGWLFGPHLELCVLGADDLDLTPQVDLVRQWLQANPSLHKVQADEYEMLSRRAGVLEGIDGPYRPVRPNNTVELVPYRHPRLVDGHEALQDCYVRFFDRSVPVLFRMVALKESDVSLANLTLTAMLARAADQFEPEGIARGYISLQAHADFFFANFDHGGQYRKRYEALSQAWCGFLENAVQGFPQHAAPNSALAAQVAQVMELWEEVLAFAKSEIKHVIQKDRSWFYYNPTAFPDELPDAPDTMALFNSAGIRIRRIEKGDTLNGLLGSIDPEFFSSEGFQTFRVILNMFYSFLRTLNVSPAERFGFCYWVATTYCRMRDEGRLLSVGEPAPPSKPGAFVAEPVSAMSGM